MGAANEDHTGAFVFGAVLAGLGAAAAVLWRAPQSGARTRAQIVGGVESALLRALGTKADQTIAPTSSAELAAAGARIPPVAGGAPTDAAGAIPSDLGDGSGAASTGHAAVAGAIPGVDGLGTNDASTDSRSIGLDDIKEHRP